MKVIQLSLVNDTALKNSAEFVNEAKTWDTSTDEIQVSFDIAAMYPSIPIKKAIEMIML